MIKKFFFINIMFTLLIFTNSFSESRFGELTEMRDEKMRGKNGQWVRPHPGPFIWNHIEKEKGNFFWDDTDKHVIYGLMQIGNKKIAKEKKLKVLLENVLQNI